MYVMQNSSFLYTQHNLGTKGMKMASKEKKIFEVNILFTFFSKMRMKAWSFKYRI